MDKEIYDLEANLIGAMALDHNRFKSAQEQGLVPEDFEVSAYRKAYEVMLDKQASDVVTLKRYMSDTQWDEVREACAYCITPAGFSTWIKVMHEKTANNKLLNLANEIPKIVQENKPIAQKIDSVNSLLIGNKITKNSGAPQEIKDVIANVKKELQNNDLMHSHLIKTGFQSPMIVL